MLTRSLNSHTQFAMCKANILKIQTWVGILFLHNTNCQIPGYLINKGKEIQIIDESIESPLNFIPPISPDE